MLCIDTCSRQAMMPKNVLYLASELTYDIVMHVDKWCATDNDTH